MKRSLKQETPFGLGRTRVNSRSQKNVMEGCVKGEEIQRKQKLSTCKIASGSVSHSRFNTWITHHLQPRSRRDQMYLPLDFVCFFIGDFPFSDMLERKQGWDSLPQSTPYPPYSGTFLVWVPPSLLLMTSFTRTILSNWGPSPLLPCVRNLQRPKEDIQP